MDFLDLVKEKMKLMEMDQALLNRPVNAGFSGGEKKRNEIFQMAVLEPKLAILDETDSGLDIDALKIVAERRERAAQPGAVHDRGHALPAAAELHRAGLRARAVRGRIVKSGGKELALELEESGYAGLGSTRRRRSAKHDGRNGTDRRVAGGVHQPAGRRAVAAGASRSGLPALRGAGLPDHARRGVALHQRGADRARRKFARGRRAPAELRIPAGVEPTAGEPGGVPWGLVRSRGDGSRSQRLRGPEHGVSGDRDMCCGCPREWWSRSPSKLRATRPTRTRSRSHPPYADPGGRQRAVHDRGDATAAPDATSPTRSPRSWGRGRGGGPLQGAAGEPAKRSTWPPCRPLGRSANFSSHSISLGGALVRNDVNAVLSEGTEATLNGLYIVNGTQHIDNHTVHRSRQAARHQPRAVQGHSGRPGRRAVFNGRIIVRKDAQKTDSKQTNKNLVLSDDAVINTKPELQILADDVRCTHGATIGQLDAEVAVLSAIARHRQSAGAQPADLRLRAGHHRPHQGAGVAGLAGTDPVREIP